MPRSVDVRAVDGSTSGSVTLDDAIFGITPNVAVMHQVVTAQLAAARSGTQSTKTRAEVSGGGKKPFRQKGTGRARQGSTRAPHWVGGGVALGPKPRSYKQRTPRKMIQLALRSALSDRASEDRVMVLAEWPWTEPKTAQARLALAALELDGRILIVLDRDTDEEAYKSFRNLPLAQVILTGELNAYDVLCNDWIVFTKATLPGTSTDEGTDTAESEGTDTVEVAVATGTTTPAAEPEAAEPEAAELEAAATATETTEPEPAEPEAAATATEPTEPEPAEPEAAAPPETAPTETAEAVETAPTDAAQAAEAVEATKAMQPEVAATDADEEETK
jgi:large subunit ribosomal protein L4